MGNMTFSWYQSKLEIHYCQYALLSKRAVLPAAMAWSCVSSDVLPWRTTPFITQKNIQKLNSTDWWFSGSLTIPWALLRSLTPNVPGEACVQGTADVAISRICSVQTTFPAVAVRNCPRFAGDICDMSCDMAGPVPVCAITARIAFVSSISEEFVEMLLLKIIIIYYHSSVVFHRKSGNLATNGICSVDALEPP